MLVDFRPHRRLRGTAPLDMAQLISPVMSALADDEVTDLAKVRLVCDWVQYKNNFRDVVDIRPILSGRCDADGRKPIVVPENVRTDDLEIAVDVRQAGGAPLGLGHAVAERLRQSRDEDTCGGVVLETWRRGSESCVWDFNARYWADLDLWEKSTGRGYEQALPGGESDGTNAVAAAELIQRLFDTWDRLSAEHALPEELYVVEFGVGNGGQSRVFLDEFRRLDAAHGRDYYQRLHYLMCDYSPHVLEIAREAISDHAERVSAFTLDATQPLTALGFLRYKVFLAYISNVYDNLPTDEVAGMGGSAYQVEVRAYIPETAARELSERLRLGDPHDLVDLVRKLLRLGPVLCAEASPQHFDSTEEAVQFWRDVWEAIRLHERYRPLSGLDLYELAPGINGEVLRPLLESGADVRMHVSNGALSSFAESLQLLHPFGSLVCHDIFVTDVDAYRFNFRGPGKYEGSVVNWVNGPLLAHLGRRHGFDVRFDPFEHGKGNIVTLSAQARD